MAYFKTTTPYSSLITATDQTFARQIYQQQIADIEPDDEPDFKEVSESQAINLVANAQIAHPDDTVMAYIKQYAAQQIHDNEASQTAILVDSDLAD